MFGLSNQDRNLCNHGSIERIARAWGQIDTFIRYTDGIGRILDSRAVEHLTGGSATSGVLINLSAIKNKTTHHRFVVICSQTRTNDVTLHRYSLRGNYPEGFAQRYDNHDLLLVLAHMIRTGENWEDKLFELSFGEHKQPNGKISVDVIACPGREASVPDTVAAMTDNGLVIADRIEAWRRFVSSAASLADDARLHITLVSIDCDFAYATAIAVTSDGDFKAICEVNSEIARHAHHHRHAKIETSFLKPSEARDILARMS